MTNNTKELLIKQKPFEALLAIHKQEEPYTKGISRQTDSDYQHMADIVGKFEDSKLVDKEKNGVKNILKLTDEGQELAREFERLDRILKEVDNE